MNSKQLNFFIVPEDLPSVYSFFNKYAIRYVAEDTHDNKKIDLKTFPYTDGEAYKQIYLVGEEFVSNLFLPEEKRAILFPVDLFKSDVLQFNPGGIYPHSSKVLHRGRFYCTTSYFVSNGESVGKSEKFKKWVDKIFRLFKKEILQKQTDTKWIYFSSKALEWKEANGGKMDKGETVIEI